MSLLLSIIILILINNNNILISFGERCDIIIHIKSLINIPFSAKIITPNGQISEKFIFSKNRQKETYHPLINGTNDCTKGQWEIQTFDQNGIKKATEKVNLSGIGRVLYEIKDYNNLQPIQSERQGAKCEEGKCAALGNKPTKLLKKNNTSDDLIN